MFITSKFLELSWTYSIDFGRIYFTLKLHYNTFKNILVHCMLHKLKLYDSNVHSIVRYEKNLL